MATPRFLLTGRQVSAIQTGVSSVAPGISDPRDPTSGGRGTQIRSSMRPGAFGELKSGLTEAMQGRISLAILEAMVIGMIGFYLWTHKAQGGG